MVMIKLKGFLVLAAAVLLAGCGGNVASAQIGDPEQGRVIYETGGAAGIPCMSCHSLDGTTIVGPSWQGIRERAATRVEGMSAEDYIRQSIEDPTAYVVDGYQPVMPDVFGEKLSDEDINNIIAYMYSLDN
jgi:cytochrome c oxidase subunit 2